MKLNPQLEAAPAGVAFVGYVGAGSRLTLKTEGRGVCIQQTLGSQLWIIFSLLAMILVPGYALVFDRAQIPNGNFATTILGFVVAIAIPFFIKYCFRLLGRRRIYVDPTLRKISLFASGAECRRHCPGSGSNYRRDSSHLIYI